MIINTLTTPNLLFIVKVYTKCTFGVNFVYLCSVKYALSRLAKHMELGEKYTWSELHDYAESISASVSYDNRRNVVYIISPIPNEKAKFAKYIFREIGDRYTPNYFYLETIKMLRTKAG